MQSPQYITEKMASVGAGVGDTLEVETICDAMSKNERDILDAWHNLGINQTMSPAYQTTKNGLRDQFSEDDLIVLAAYVSARRNVEEY